MQPGRPPPPSFFAPPSSSSAASSSSNNPHPHHHHPAAPHQPAQGFSSFGERGRGRGGGRGGAQRGAPRGAGAPRHSNLSWRKPAEGAATAASTTDASALAPAPAPAPASAFAAFGAPAAPPGSAFGSTSSSFSTAAGAPDPSSFGAFGGGGGATSAFGAPAAAPAATAFGGGAGAGAFGGSAFGGSAFGTSSSTAFPSSFAPAAASAFAMPSAFSAAPPASSAPLFRRPSSEGQGGEQQDEDEQEDEQDDEQDDDEPEDEPEQGALRTAGQISTLEVLGEDSDARKKRFEATLPNNRYLELKPLREAQRLEAIKAGLIPDPSKPMRLDQATDFEGTCVDMCPEWEREEREYQNNVDPLERYPGTTRIDPSRAVKAFHRPAAGNDQPLPSDVRPPRVLHQTLDYLFHALLPTLPLATTHPFLRDRTRSVRQDFTVQNVRGASAIECNERIARYHILAVGALREQSGFSESQELEQLRKVLKSLNEFYDDARVSGLAVPSPNEAEFRAYNLLTHLRDPDIVWSTELLPHALFAHPLLQRALALHRLAQRANLARGERASPGAFARFFKLVADPQTPYLFACILSTHFAEVRRGALEALRGAFLRQHSALPLATVARMLGCDDEDEARSVCEQVGLVVRSDEGGTHVVEVHKQAVLKATTLKPHVSLRLVEAKRGAASYQDVIDGKAASAAPVVAAAPGPSRPPPSFAAAAPQPASSFAPAPAPRVAPTLSGAAPAFSFAPRPAASASPLPTPFDSPALGPTPGSSAPLNGLSAAAPSFVPSLSLPTASVPVAAAAAPAPASAFGPSTSARPLAATAPAFSFAPASTAPAPPPPAATPATPAAAAAPPGVGDARPTKRLPPSLLRTAVSAAPFIPSTASTLAAPSPLAPPPARPSLSPSARLAAPTRRVSHPLSPVAHAHAHPPHAPHAAEAPFPSSVSAAATAARAQRVAALAGALSAELLGGLARAAAGRAGALALRERWAAVREGERRGREALSEGMARRAIEELGRLAAREAVLLGMRDEGRRKAAWGDWRRALQARRRWKAEQRDKKRVLDDVVRGIERGKEDGRAEGDDTDDVLTDDDDDGDAGLAGLADTGLDFGGLSLGGGGASSSSSSRPKLDLARRVRDAADTRDRIWQRGTFLNHLSAFASTALANLARPLPTRPTWTTLVAVEAAQTPFAAWLVCKLDLDARQGTAEVDAPGADVEVRMLSDGDEPVESELRSSGLVVIDCTASKSRPHDWTTLRTRLHSLVARASDRSLFRPAVLAVICPTRTLSTEETAALRAQVRDELQLAALEGQGSRASVWITQCEGAEGEFEKEVRALVGTVQVCEERIPRPISNYLDPLLAAWQRSSARTYKLLQDEGAAPTFASTYLERLQDAVRQAEVAASPAPRSRLQLPPLVTTDSSFRTALERYAALPDFRSAGHFPDLAVALAQRPPLTDLALARLTIEHLAQFAASALASLKVPTGSLSNELPDALAHLDDALTAAELKLRPRSPAPTPPATPQQRAPAPSGKKRRASAAPSEMATSPKKHSGAARDERDRLSALEGLMKDARALLSR